MRLSYDPIYNSGITGLVLTILVVSLLFWIMPLGVTRGRRRLLLALRGIAAITLVLAMLRPSWVQTDNRPAAATLAIAIDTSRSMTLASGDPSVTTPAGGANEGHPNVPSAIGGAENRWHQQWRSLTALAEGLSSLDDHLNVSLYRFDDSSERLVGGPAGDLSRTLPSLDTVQPDGRLSNLASPLEAAVATSRSTPLAGIVLISDGTQTMPSDAGQTSDPVASAQWVASIGVPLWTVALGPRAASGPERDVSVSSLPETYRMFTGNETDVSLEVQTRGYAGTPIELTLVWVDEAGEQTVAATRTITSDQDASREVMNIPVVAPDPGQYRLIAGVSSPAGETDTTNDQQISFVDVRSGGGRVLYLEGTPRLEQRYLRRALRRFPDLELTYRWIPRDTSSLWPIDLDDDLQPGRFDVIILGDLHSAALGQEQLSRIAELVASGTALLTLGGERTYGPGGYEATPLANVLPVQLDGATAQSPGRETSDLRRPLGPDGAEALLPGQLAGPVSLHIAAVHPITRIDLDASQSDEDEWLALPAMPGGNRFAGVKVAPGVQVLLEDSQAQPMMVVGEFGQGRVASLAFDSTWIWWTSGASEFHRRYWRQLMLWMLSREETTEGELELTMTRRRMSTSERSLFTATQRPGGEGEGVGAGDWTVEVVSASGDVRSLDVTTTTRGSGDAMRVEASGEVAGAAADENAETLTNGLPPGIYRLRVRSSDSAGQAAAAELPFQVIDDTRELAVRNADHALLDRLALITEAAGGESFRADQISELIERIGNQRRRAERAVIEKWRLGDGPLSGWLVFGLFAGSLCVEWILRRRWGLA
ncbi:hypothetical protein [Allorhodopirellula solitaria]|uniref:Glutamine amidotransferase domain-containing protein n=1 Tax=Allorhodopirellula solitaria TaxID=2527987 RepID=A0A5C5XPE9_9BACT|nr:hypothetical protein [Allorhodopirellula solitaria]TWT64800.1 hypothetical protein CA85_35850 [Allorhodopirellula solitaria]